MNRYKVRVENGKVVVTPSDHFNAYIQTRYGSHRVNTQKKYAETIRRFLGENAPEKVDAEMVARYLKERATSGITGPTFEKERVSILDFVTYLEENNVIEIIDKAVFFREPAPAAKKSTAINDIRSEYIPLLFKTCSETEPELVLFLLLSISAGLRASECLNLTKDSISVTEHGCFVIDVRDRVLRNNQSEAVKTARIQKSLPVGNAGIRIYQHHLENYTHTDSPALFIDRHGHAMSYQALHRRFEKIKIRFISALTQSIDPNDVKYGSFLEDHSWGAMIGRGIYCHELIRQANNMSKLAHMRQTTGITNEYLNSDVEDNSNGK